MTTTEVRYPNEWSVKSIFEGLMWGVITLSVWFVFTFVSIQGVLMSAHHFIGRDVPATPYGKTSLRVYEPLRAPYGDFRLQMTVSDAWTQSAYCRACYDQN